MPAMKQPLLFALQRKPALSECSMQKPLEGNYLLSLGIMTYILDTITMKLKQKNECLLFFPPWCLLYSSPHSFQLRAVNVFIAFFIVAAHVEF